MSLLVGGSESFQATVLRALQCLDLRIEIIPGGQVNIDTTVEGHRSRLKSRELLHSLIVCSPTIRIEYAPGQSECVPADRTGSTGSLDSTVMWNPEQHLPGAMRACRCIYLGHELCHSHQILRHAISPSEFYAGRAAKMRYEMLNITGSYGRESVGTDAITENHLREEHIPRQNPRTTL